LILHVNSMLIARQHRGDKIEKKEGENCLKKVNLQNECGQISIYSAQHPTSGRNYPVLQLTIRFEENREPAKIAG